MIKSGARGKNSGAADSLEEFACFGVLCAGGTCRPQSSRLLSPLRSFYASPCMRPRMEEWPICWAIARRAIPAASRFPFSAY